MIDKKEAIKEYKQTVQPMGIFQIRNLANEKIYLASSKNLRGMANRFEFNLDIGAHVSKELREDYEKFGRANFVFEVIDTLESKEDPKYDYTEDLKVLEEMWLEKLQPYDYKGYNQKKD
ncbi:MAG: GIY-YIG nuclease family protein [Stygiobacter sp.]|nr:MAG: GIY-YIG nuclease family protein [Stygiobacter sp.]